MMERYCFESQIKRQFFLRFSQFVLVQIQEKRANKISKNYQIVSATKAK